MQQRKGTLEYCFFGGKCSGNGCWIMTVFTLEDKCTFWANSALLHNSLTEKQSHERHFSPLPISLMEPGSKELFKPDLLAFLYQTRALYGRNESRLSVVNVFLISAVPKLISLSNPIFVGIVRRRLKRQSTNRVFRTLLAPRVTANTSM